MSGNYCSYLSIANVSEETIVLRVATRNSVLIIVFKPRTVENLIGNKQKLEAGPHGPHLGRGSSVLGWPTYLKSSKVVTHLPA